MGIFPPSDFELKALGLVDYDFDQHFIATNFELKAAMCKDWTPK